MESVEKARECRENLWSTTRKQTTLLTCWVLINLQFSFNFCLKQPRAGLIKVRARLTQRPNWTEVWYVLVAEGGKMEKWNLKSSERPNKSSKNVWTLSEASVQSVTSSLSQFRLLSVARSPRVMDILKPSASVSEAFPGPNALSTLAKKDRKKVSFDLLPSCGINTVFVLLCLFVLQVLVFYKLSHNYLVLICLSYFAS